MLRSRPTHYHLVLAVALVMALAVCLATSGAMRWSLLAVVCSLTGLTVGLGVSFPQWQMFGESFCRARTTEKIVALTFDDGPDPETTPALLELLEKRRASATFFCVGHRVSRHPELVRRIVSEGHSVENHTYRHHVATNVFSVATLHEDLTQAQDAIRRAAGRAPAFFRPPMGLTNGRVFQVCKALRLTVTGYTVRGLDRRNHPPDRIARRLLRGLKPGSILLLHDAGVPRLRLLAVVTQVLDEVQAAGYQCVRLDQLLAQHEAHP